MCGRYVLASGTDRVAKFFGLAIGEAPALRPRYNIAPTQEAPIVRLAREGRERQLSLLRWGLVPWWAADPGIGSRMINARSETAAKSRAFRDALARRRCLVPVDGFYEWRTTPTGKQPYLITTHDGSPFALAGLWERWRERPPGDARDEAGTVTSAGAAAPDPNTRVIDSFTILTTHPNDLIADLHDRMPVVIAPADFVRWLDRDERRAAAVSDLLGPLSSEHFRIFPVSRRVNDPAHDDAGCVERVDPEPAAARAPGDVGAAQGSTSGRRASSRRSARDEDPAQGTLFES